MNGRNEIILAIEEYAEELKVGADYKFAAHLMGNSLILLLEQQAELDAKTKD